MRLNLYQMNDAFLMRTCFLLTVITLTFAKRENFKSYSCILSDIDLKQPASLLFPKQMLEPLPDASTEFTHKHLSEKDEEQIEKDVKRIECGNTEHLTDLLKRLFGSWENLYYSQVRLYYFSLGDDTEIRYRVIMTFVQLC